MNRRNQTIKTRRNFQTYNRHQNIIPYQSAVKLGPVSNTFFIALMIAVLGLIYLTQATRTTSYDYHGAQLSREIANLEAQKTDLEVEKARLTSLASVESSSLVAQMTKPAEVDYVRD